MKSRVIVTTDMGMQEWGQALEKNAQE